MIFVLFYVSAGWYYVSSPPHVHNKCKFKKQPKSHSKMQVQIWPWKNIYTLASLSTVTENMAATVKKKNKLCQFCKRSKVETEL